MWAPCENELGHDRFWERDGGDYINLHSLVHMLFKSAISVGNDCVEDHEALRPVRPAPLNPV